MGRISKGEQCQVLKCTNQAIRSISIEKVKSAGLPIDANEKRAYLCKEHYKQYKKKTKSEQRIEKWRFNVS